MKEQRNTCDLSLPDAQVILKEQERFANELRIRPGEKKPPMGVSPAELIRSFGEAEKQMPLPPVGRYGGYWHYDATEGWVCCDAGGHHYDFALEDHKLDEMAIHLAEKSWIHAEALGDFILMLRHVFGMHTWKDKPRFNLQEPRTPA